MCQKLKELFVEAKDPRKTYFIEKTRVSCLRGGGGERKKGGPKMKVSLTMLLKTNVEKMSVLHPETMSMKTSNL
jgi:hypothetical protein